MYSTLNPERRETLHAFSGREMRSSEKSLATRCFAWLKLVSLLAVTQRTRPGLLLMVSLGSGNFSGDGEQIFWQEEELREKEEFGPSPTQADTFLCLCWPFANGNRARS
ncbi:hypothetical protein DdX_03460 [Ditylenchus destructor]|uniref:Uncharacterized protein n=1 Tax=Ditylenchus destructor TaxID=166010 RepID=A0AAD4NBQ7_9BILA|nr:hypothetical protein DdX_03460 [Ditylenchus destructor]